MAQNTRNRHNRNAGYVFVLIVVFEYRRIAIAAKPHGNQYV